MENSKQQRNPPKQNKNNQLSALIEKYNHNQVFKQKTPHRSGYYLPTFKSPDTRFCRHTHSSLTRQIITGHHRFCSHTSKLSITDVNEIVAKETSAMDFSRGAGYALLCSCAAVFVSQLNFAMHRYGILSSRSLSLLFSLSLSLSLRKREDRH